MKQMIRARNVCKTYRVGELDVPVIKGIDFEIFEGEFIVILGPSGSGKSTVLNMLGGIDTLTSGTLHYKDIPLHTANEKALTAYRREHVGFVFQFYNLIPNLTARENIEMTAELTFAPIDVTTLLDKIGLADKGDYFPAKLSGGQQQRVAIARALAKNPDLLLCDEPTGALDVQTGQQVLDVLVDFNRDYGKTVVIITHNGDIAQIARRVFTIKDGYIVKTDVNTSPVSPKEVVW